MPKARSRLRRDILFLLTYSFFHLCRVVPLPYIRRIGAALAKVAYWIVPRIRQVGMANLNLAYGEMLSKPEKQKLLIASVKNLATVAVEFPHLPRLIANGLDQWVIVRGKEYLDTSQGAILIGAHLGNWEWMLPMSKVLGLRITVVVRKFDDPRVDKLIGEVRQASGIQIVYKDNALPELMKALRSGGQVGILVDQNPRDNAVPCTFFGKNTWASIGPVLLALRTRAPIHPVSMTRSAQGTYVLEFYPAIEINRTDNLLNDLQVNTQRCQDALESIIRKYPEQWLWFHRRWKHRDRLEREWKMRASTKEKTPDVDTCAEITPRC